MIRNYRLLPWLPLAVLALLSACNGRETVPEVAADYPRLVKTLVLNAADQGDGIILPGRVAATRTAELAFQVQGPLIDLPVVEGQFVPQGQLLARLDPRDYENQLAVVKAQLQASERQYQRYAKLIQNRTAPVSKAQVDRAKRDYEVARSALEQAQKNLQDTELKAPFAGVVAVRYVNNHENVQARQPILRLEDMSAVDVVVDVPEHLMARARAGVGDEVGVVTLAALPDSVFPVRLKEYATQADAGTQTYQVSLTMPRPPQINLLPGMTVTFSSALAGGGSEEGFLLPRTAVGQADDESYVWVVDETLSVQRRPVTLSEDRSGAVRVTAGLKAGERVVVAGVDGLDTGMKVRLYRVGLLGS